MNRLRISSLFLAFLISISLLTGCNTKAPQMDSPSALQSTDGEPSPDEQSEEPGQQSEQSDRQVREANWIIEIDDTQQITDEMGLIWNYKLSLYASKTGGKDVLGNYSGEIVLDMEPDYDSAKALAQKEGAELLSMLFKHHSEAENIAFEVVEYRPETYSALMKENIPDNPLLQISDPDSETDALAITRITFKATQEPINMTISSEGSVYSGSIPGGETTVNVPMEIMINGASVRFYLFETVHPLERAFEGVVTGDVLP